MATRGFEFAYMLDGGNATPVIRDWEMAADSSGYEQGDLLVIDSSGRADKAATNATEVLGVVMERNPNDVSADDLLKIAVITRDQVWRCSTDAATTTGVKGYTKTMNIVDENTIDADVITSGAMCVVENTDTDDDGYILMYVNFVDTTFGNT